jgi:hypothetical protein
MRPVWRIALAIAGIVLVTAVATGTFAALSQVRMSAYDAAHARGFAVFGDDARLREALLPAAWRWACESVAGREIPELVFDIAFVDLEALRRKRDEAIARGILVSEADDFVPATIRTGNASTEVRLRLKGDQVDHLQGDRWSFRVETKGDGQVFGLRRFSVQSPTVRSYQLERLFFETLKRYDVLAPRYFFARVRINGDDVGLMAVEEHFSKELLESSQRREGVILRFDESRVWSANDGRYHGFWGAFDSYYNAPVDAFRESVIEGSAVLSEQLRFASGLLRGHVRGTLPAAQVFDVERLGTFLAVVDFWGAWHAALWNQLRFYYNPITARLEPIAYDANIGLGRPRPPGSALRRSPFARRVLGDPAVRAAYELAFERLARDLRSGELLADLEALQERQLRILRSEFFLLEEFDLSELQTWAEDRPRVDTNLFPTLVNAYRVRNETGESWLELSNPLDYPVEIIDLREIAPDGQALELELIDPLALPLPLPATPFRERPRVVRLGYRGNDEDGTAHEVEVVARITGEMRLVTTTALAAPPIPPEGPIPSSSLEEQLEIHHFLSADRERRVLLIPRGEWQLESSLVAPDGWGLEVEAGARLRIASDSRIVVHGAAAFNGTPGLPIVLEPLGAAEEGWQGMAVLGAESRSLVRNTIFRGTTGVAAPGWILTGGVTFYESDVSIEESSFEDNRAEDALNIVRSQFTLHRVRMSRTRSDAFDADFSNGTVEASVFQDIGLAGGGDGIDVSGSVIEINDVRLARVSDKAISVGEGSEARVTDVEIADAGVGIAAKDASEVAADRITIERAGVASLMAYVKKQEYGPASLEVRALDVGEGSAPPRAQLGSTLSVEGGNVSPEPLDVDRLYATVMRKAGH